ncbi:hypothetical protein N7509_004925 [Penicillium cosmopolitanum]|uniref:Uncharacterized protein n=1 Tax=Penicillium cosmopolitanum TaxID=1131564 RepID=A0A9X0B9L6_9EURO|nr:uncharacterized protein N7509_004925 [Penicillium cosmopolitanum]KAJ5396812.1 hypothetical protein N7509_004925 [Penicillium cosmopolitanum]
MYVLHARRPINKPQPQPPTPTPNWWIALRMGQRMGRAQVPWRSISSSREAHTQFTVREWLT